MMRIFYFLFLVSFSSCMLGPKKETPDVPLPSSYIELESHDEVSKEPLQLASWWKQFDDSLLDELIAICLEKNFDLQTATEQIEKARASLTTANARLFPFVNLFGAPARLKTSNNLTPSLPAVSPSGNSSIRDLFVLGFDASWEIDLFGKNRSRKEEAFYNWKASEENKRALEISVIAEVARLYTEIRGLQQRIEVTKKRIFVYENLIKLSENLEQSGLQGMIPLEETHAVYAAVKSTLHDLQKGLDLSIANLAFVLGGEISTYKEKLMKAGPLPQPFGRVPVGLPSDLLKQRPDIRSAEASLFASGAALGKTKAELLPSLSLTGVIGNSAKIASKLFQSGSRFWAIFPDFDWSLFQGGSTLAQIDIATSEQKQAAIHYEKTVLSALKEVESSLIQYRESAGKTEDLLVEFKSKKSILQLSENLFSSGLSSLPELLEVYDSAFAVQNDYITAKESTMLGLIALYKSLGGSL